MRIASLLSSGTEILFALGLGEQIVAVSHECDYPPAARDLPQVTQSLIDGSAASGQIDEQVKSFAAGGGALYRIDADRLCQLRPQLILTQSQCDVCAVRYEDVIELVETRAPLRQTEVLALGPQSLDDVLGDVIRVGRAAGAILAADVVVAGLRCRIEAVQARIASLGAAARPSVVCLEWLDPPMAAGNWTPQLIELAGGQSNLATTGKHSGYVTWDQVRQVDPEVLLVAPCGFDLARTQSEAAALASQPGFRDLAAVRGGRAFAIDGNAYLNRSGPRLIETLELLACLLHPRLFSAPAGELAEGRAWSRLGA